METDAVDSFADLARFLRATQELQQVCRFGTQ